VAPCGDVPRQVGDARPDPVASSDNGTFIFSLAYLDEAPPAVIFAGIASR